MPYQITELHFILVSPHNEQCSLHQEGDGAQHHTELAVADLAIAVPVHGVNHLIHLSLGNLAERELLDIRLT